MRIISLILLLSSSSVAFAKSTNIGTTSGRFQIIQISDMRRDQYLIDSQTGKLWTKVCISKDDGSCGNEYWTPEIIENITHKTEDVYRYIKAVKESK